MFYWTLVLNLIFNAPTIIIELIVNRLWVIFLNKGTCPLEYNGSTYPK